MFHDQDNNAADPEQNWELQDEIEYWLDEGFPRSIATEYAYQTLELN